MTCSLDRLSVASPCPADWEAMTGDERVRFCGLCQLNVYNLSGMSRTEAEDLIQTTEGRLCVRYFQRPDGTVITRDCPVGLQTLRKRKIRKLSRFAAAVTLITVAGSFCVSLAEGPSQAELGLVRMGDVAEPHAWMGEPVAPSQGNVMMGAPAISRPNPDPAVQGQPVPPPPERAMMGKIAAPTHKPPVQRDKETRGK